MISILAFSESLEKLLIMPKIGIKMASNAIFKALCAIKWFGNHFERLDTRINKKGCRTRSRCTFMELNRP